jgi:hypothetical protein
MHGPLQPNPGADRPTPIGVREGRRTSLIELPRVSGLAGERSGKASEKNLLTRSHVDPAVALRKPRPKVVAAPPVATFLLVEISRQLKGKWGGDQDYHTQKASAPAAALRGFPSHFPGFFKY